MATRPGLHELPSSQYGQKAALEQSNAMLPAGGQPFISPDEVPNLSDDTSRPDEPVTAGLVSGPGPGPEALGPAGAADPTRQVLQQMLIVSPNNDIMRLLDLLDIQGR